MIAKLKKVKEKINSKNLMILISAVVMLILLISATVAWFVLSRDAKINLFNNKISEWDFIVSDTSGGEPISDSSVLNFNIDEFVNVKNKAMAPGTYGSFDLYIRTSTDVVTEYTLFLDNTGLRLEVYSDDAQNDEEKEAEKEENSSMLRKHIRFYQDEQHTKELNMTEPLKGQLQANTEEKVTIYWYWLYDGSDEISDDMTQEEKEEFLRKWDLEDNFISDNKDKLSGTVNISVFASQQIPDKSTSGKISNE